MSNKNDWLLEDHLKDSDVLTFKVLGGRNGQDYECSYKYKNFKANLRRNAESFLNGTLVQLMKDSHDSVILSGDGVLTVGKDCELSQNGLDKKGKIRLKVLIEFIPEEVEVPHDSVISGDERSPLDDIRQINL